MDAKLTLTIERSLIATAKDYAKVNRRSLSDMIENYLKLLVIEPVAQKTKLTPTVKMLKGSFQAPADFDYRKELTDRLTEKYLNE